MALEKNRPHAGLCLCDFLLKYSSGNISTVDEVSI